MEPKGTYTKASADAYVTATYCSHGIKSVEELSTLEVKQVYTAFGLDPALNPYGVIRECCDCVEQPFRSSSVSTLQGAWAKPQGHALRNSTKSWRNCTRSTQTLSS